MKKTKWFPASEKPVRVGWYECQYQGWFGTSYRWWDGRRWTDDKNGTLTGFGAIGYTGDKWRGLAEESK